MSEYLLPVAVFVGGRS